MLTALERVLDVMRPDVGSVGEDADHVEAQGIEVCFSGVEVVFGYGAQGILLAGCDGLQWVSEAGPAPQFDLDEDERLGSLVQNTMTSEVRFRAELSEYGVEQNLPSRQLGEQGALGEPLIPLPFRDRTDYASRSSLYRDL